ncbi:MAG: DUF721 domain-containing protein [Actinomycetota bacterium]
MSDDREAPADLARAAFARARAAATRRRDGSPAGQPVGGPAGTPGGGRAGGRAGGRPAALARSGAGPDDRDPQPVAAVLARLLAERGWEEPAAAGQVVGRWAEIVGAPVAEHCRPEGFRDGVLTVVADSTAWAVQIRLLAPQLLARIAAEVGAGTVTRVQVRGPTAPSWRRGRRTVPGRGPRDTYG